MLQYFSNPHIHIIDIKVVAQTLPKVCSQIKSALWYYIEFNEKVYKYFRYQIDPLILSRLLWASTGYTLNAH